MSAEAEARGAKQRTINKANRREETIFTRLFNNPPLSILQQSVRVEVCALRMGLLQQPAVF